MKHMKGRSWGIPYTVWAVLVGGFITLVALASRGVLSVDSAVHGAIILVVLFLIIVLAILPWSTGPVRRKTDDLDGDV